MNSTTTSTVMDEKLLTTTTLETSSTIPDRSRSTSPQPPTGTRTLEISFDSWTWRHGTITDADTQTPLYKLEYHMRNPQITMHSAASYQSMDGAPIPIDIKEKPSPETELGSVKMHCMTSRIDTTLHGADLPIHSKGIFKNGYTFESRAAGSTFTWKSKSKCGYFDLLCFDEAETQVARIVLFMMKGKSRAGKLQLTEGNQRVGEKRLPAMVDEIVLTGLAVLQARLNAYSASMGQTAVVSAVAGS